MSDWPVVAVGQVAVINPSEPPLDPDAPFITMADVAEWGQWAKTSGPRGDRAGMRARSGDTIMARITPCLENGKIAKVPPHLERVGGSTEFIVLRAERNVLPDFLFLWAASEATHQAAVGLMTGTTGRQRVSGVDIATLPIAVPPLHEQRRMVDLIGALDAQITALAAEQASLLSLLEQTGWEQLQLPGDGGDRSLNSLLVRSIGGLWGDAPGVRDLDVAVFRSTEFTDFGFLSGPADAQRSITEKEYSGRALEPGDVLVEKSGGTPTRSVGRVVRLDESDLGAPSIGANFLQLLRVNEEKANPSYVFWLLWMGHHRGDAVNFQQASTNIRNLRTQEYLRREVALPSIAEQGRQAMLLDSLLDGWLALRSEITSARTLRRRLLAALLNGEIEIPLSYDALLAVAV